MHYASRSRLYVYTTIRLVDVHYAHVKPAHASRTVSRVHVYCGNSSSINVAGQTERTIFIETKHKRDRV